MGFAVVLQEIKTLGQTKSPSKAESLCQPWLIPIKIQKLKGTKQMQSQKHVKIL